MLGSAMRSLSRRSVDAATGVSQRRVQTDPRDSYRATFMMNASWSSRVHQATRILKSQTCVQAIAATLRATGEPSHVVELSGAIRPSSAAKLTLNDNF